MPRSTRIRPVVKWVAALCFAVLGAALVASWYLDAFWVFKGGMAVSIDGGYLSLQQGEPDNFADIGAYPMGWPVGGHGFHKPPFMRGVAWWPVLGFRSGTRWEVSVAIWPLLCTAAGVASLLWRADRREARDRRRRAGLCPACGYDRSGLVPGAPCPECGDM